jgi:hypothetical protein
MSRGPYTPLEELVQRVALEVLRNRGRVERAELFKEIAASVGFYSGAHRVVLSGEALRRYNRAYSPPRLPAQAIYRGLYERMQTAFMPRTTPTEFLIDETVRSLVESRRVRRVLATDSDQPYSGWAALLYAYSTYYEMDLLDRVATAI